jgi:hypothetical protein
MSHPFRHFITIEKHRHQVIRNAFHMGIFFQALRHDLSKFSYTEFHNSAKYATGSGSPVWDDRLHNDYYSVICQHHTKRNKHHWEYWTDFFVGRVIAINMPYRFALEYCCDVLSAAKTYDKKDFRPDTALHYFQSKKAFYYMTDGTKEFIEWCLAQYAENGFHGLHRRQTKPKYQEIMKRHPSVKIFSALDTDFVIPPLAK